MSNDTARTPREKTARWLATTFGLGEVLPAPGTTAGSLPAATIWALLAMTLSDPQRLLVVTALMAVASIPIAIWAAGADASRRGTGDPGPVVIDEVAGQWLCFAVALLFVEPVGAGATLLFTAAGFLAFRLFDIWKPWPVRRLEQLSGGFGIVADDLAAGALAGLVIATGWRVILG